MVADGMATEADEDDTSLSPDDAFAVLGNETRMDILQTLGDADEALAFSELRDRVGVRDSGQFNYHLDKLDGHFISKTDEAYELRQAGRRVIEAVLSGAVTDAPVMGRTEIEVACPYCDAPIEVRFIEERVETYCTNCAGTFGESQLESAETPVEGFLGNVSLPPAGIQGRTPRETVEAGTTWGNLEFMALASGVCPRCSAPLDTAVDVCQEHDTTGGLCERCNNLHQVHGEWECTNCIFFTSGLFVLNLMTNPAFLSFQIDHDLNPISPTQVSEFMQMLLDHDEEILSTDPFEARFTFTIDGDPLTVTVDDDLIVSGVTE